MLNPERTLNLGAEDITNIIDNSDRVRYIFNKPINQVIASPRLGIGDITINRTNTDGKSGAMFNPTEYLNESNSVIYYNDILRKGIGGNPLVTPIKARNRSTDIIYNFSNTPSKYRLIRYGVYDYSNFTDKYALANQKYALKDEETSKILSLDGMRTRRLKKSAELSDHVKIMTEIGYISVAKYRELTGETPSVQDWLMKCRYRFRDLLRCLHEDYNILNPMNIKLSSSVAKPEEMKERITLDSPLKSLSNQLRINNDITPTFYENVEFLIYEILVRAGRDENEAIANLAYNYMSPDIYSLFLDQRARLNSENEYNDVLSIGRDIFGRKFQEIDGLQDFFINYLSKVNILGEQVAIMHKKLAYSDGRLNNQNISFLFEIVDNDVTELHAIRPYDAYKMLSQAFESLTHLTTLLIALNVTNIVSDDIANFTIDRFLEGFITKLGDEFTDFQDTIRNWFEKLNLPLLENQYLYKITKERIQELEDVLNVSESEIQLENPTSYINEYNQCKELLDKMCSRLEYCPISSGWARTDHIIGNGIYLYAIKYLIAKA